MTSESRNRHVRYKNPPIIERVASVTADITEENFYSKFASWKEALQPEFPDYDPVKRWKLNFSMKGDVPVLEDSGPRIEVTHRFWKHNQKGKKFMSMRVLPNQFTLNLHPERDKPHNFEELYQVM